MFGDGKKKLYSREWLNAPGHHGNGYVVTEVESGRNDGRTTWVSGDVTIADCSRSISLDFYITDHRDQDVLDAMKANDLAKIDLLISELQEFRRVLKREAKKVKPHPEDTA